MRCARRERRRDSCRICGESAERMPTHTDALFVHVGPAGCRGRGDRGVFSDRSNPPRSAASRVFCIDRSRVFRFVVRECLRSALESPWFATVASLGKKTDERRPAAALSADRRLSVIYLLFQYSSFRTLPLLFYGLDESSGLTIGISFSIFLSRVF